MGFYEALKFCSQWLDPERYLDVLLLPQDKVKRLRLLSPLKVLYSTKVMAQSRFLASDKDRDRRNQDNLNTAI